MQEHPELLADVMKAMETRLDHARVVGMFRKEGHLPLIKDYLLNVQKVNILEVNEAVNELLVDEEDFGGLRSSITTYDNFDQVSLCELCIY